MDRGTGHAPRKRDGSPEPCFAAWLQKLSVLCYLGHGINATRLQFKHPRLDYTYSMVSTHSEVERQAEALLGSTGARRSSPRKRVLMFLLEQDRALTRTEIQRHMDGKPLGGVTLYRVLVWLTASGLVHRISCSDQSRRFRANRQASAREHAHFQCTRCGGVTCLHEVLLPAQIAVPPGFTRREADFLIRGTCPGCGSAQGQA